MYNPHLPQAKCILLLLFINTPKFHKKYLGTYVNIKRFLGFTHQLDPYKCIINLII